jgi:hypothetical protein
MRYVSRIRVIAAWTLGVWLCLPTGASAQDQKESRPSSFRTAVLGAAAIPGGPESAPASLRTDVPGSEMRPAALLPLYASLGVLQAMDVHSTSRGLAAGGREANPVMQSVVRNRAAFVGVKVATTAGVVWASERLWRKQNRKAAVVLTALTNIGLAAVVAHNYRVAR